MYIINQRIRKEPHYLNHAILLSPAGIHTNAPLAVGVTGFLFKHIFARVFDHVAFPNSVVGIVQKVHRDVRSLPATRDLLTFISSQVLGG